MVPRDTTSLVPLVRDESEVGGEEEEKEEEDIEKEDDIPVKPPGTNNASQRDVVNQDDVPAYASTWILYSQNILHHPDESLPTPAGVVEVCNKAREELLGNEDLRADIRDLLGIGVERYLSAKHDDSSWSGLILAKTHHYARNSWTLWATVTIIIPLGTWPCSRN